MKKLFTFLLAIIISVIAFGQKRAIIEKSLRDISIKMEKPMQESSNFLTSPYQYQTLNFPPEEEQIGGTRYDDQANASCQNRIFLFEDGTIGATWTRAINDGSFDDRGAAYNYFDGNEWGPYPTERVEEERTGWPSYFPFGENGEMIVSHGSNGRVVSFRAEKGTGDWTYNLWPGPSGHEYVIWNRSISSGPDNASIHSLAVTASTVYGGTLYEDLNGALVYSYSPDGGSSWEIENEILDGMSSDDYIGFDGDTYNFAEPKGDIIAFTVGESWYDLFLMKSTDGGQTFEKTLIWEHPYPFFDTQTPVATDTFYCADGSHHPVIDNNGKVHVVFGINRANSDDAGTYWFPFVDGVGYWNEDMPAFSNNLHALDPYGHPDSELIEDYNLIGWTQDVDLNGTIDIIDEIGTYYIGLSSMVQVACGPNNELYVVWSSVTETYDNGITNYRHLWARTSPNAGESWGPFFDLTSDLIHIFDECVYPSIAANTDDYLHLVYQTDVEPGINIWGTGHPLTDNNINYMKVLRDDITGIDKPVAVISDYDVSSVYPNPVSGNAEIRINIRQKTELTVKISNLTGQEVYTSNNGIMTPGMKRFTFDASKLSEGVYFYTIQAGENSVTRKFIVN